MQIRRGLVFLLLLFTTNVLLIGSTAMPLVLESQVRHQLAGHISFYEDLSGKASLADVAEVYARGGFVAGADVPSALDVNKDYWIHFTIDNTAERSYPWMLRFGTPLSSADIYALYTDTDCGAADTVWTHVESVNNYHKLKSVITPLPGVTTQYFVHIYQHLPMTVTLRNVCLSPYEEYSDSFIEQSSIVGFIVGIMFLLLMYHTFMLSVRRKSLYFYYVLYLLFHIGYVLYGSYYVEYVLIDQHQLSFSWMYMSFSIGIFFYSLFVREFVSPANMPDGVDRWFFRPYLVFLLLSNICMLILMFLGNSWFYPLYMLIPIVYSVLGLVLALTLMVRVKVLEIRLILIGSTITVTTGLLAIYLDMSNLLDNNHVYNFGMVADVLFYSYAINLKHRHERRRTLQQEAELHQLQAKMESQQRELTSKALYISQQDQILADLRTQIVRSQDSGAVSADMNTMLANLERHVHQSSWDEFERYFIEVHPSFYHQLKERFPELSQHELRLCALLRLNLNTKQIADITQKTTKSIDVTRSRIRQKMHLSREESLFDVIARM